MQSLIVAGLEERWGTLDVTKNSDLNDIAVAYRDAVFLVAHRHGEIVGTGALIAEGPGVGCIVYMSVDKARRCQGIGSQILQRLLAYTRPQRYQRIVLETTASWRDAVAFDQRHGFIRLGVQDGDMHFELRLSSTAG